jgi:hypothetical protein
MDLQFRMWTAQAFNRQVYTETEPTTVDARSKA